MLTKSPTQPLINPFTDLNTGEIQVSLVRGEGVHVFDSAGRPYIDAMAGMWCVTLGYGNAELADAAREQMMTLSFAHIFRGAIHERAAELAERLSAISPIRGAKVFFCSSGSEANDTQFKLMRYYNNARGRPNKKKIISRMRGYHGSTVATSSLTGLASMHQGFDLPLGNVRFVSCPTQYWLGKEGESEQDFATRLAQELEDLIVKEGPDTVAAFIAEPVMGAGGVVVPPETYFEKIQAVLARHDVLLIADEVVTGFGRLGRMFGSEVFNIQPHTMTLAKGLSSAYVPIGAVVVGEDVFDAMREQSRTHGSFAHGFTYSGHPVAAAVALKALDIYQRDDIPGRVRELAPLFEARIKAFADHPLIGDTRCMGLIGALEIVADKKAKRAFDMKGDMSRHVATACHQFALQEGVITRSVMDAMAISPPLTINADEINELFDRLGRALDRTEQWVVQEKLRDL